MTYSRHVIISVSQWRLIAALMRPAVACSYVTLHIDASMVHAMPGLNSPMSLIFSLQTV
jgi:hypothetical protein